MTFDFDNFRTIVNITNNIPVINQIIHDLGLDTDISFKPLIVADENTAYIAKKICDDRDLPLCILKSGEENKNWQSVETILFSAFKAGLGRDGVFIAVGGGVVCDLTGFAASIYKRGCRFILVSTTLLGMVDASVGGKTGFDLFDIKNLTGTFYPAENVYMPLECLNTLPQKEWKSGMAELIKTAVLDNNDFLEQIENNNKQLSEINNQIVKSELLFDCIKRSVNYKGKIVSEDFRESSDGKRKLLNLGHTFGHALESVAGFGNITHGEAVTWGMVRACELGCEMGITPSPRAKKIKDIIYSFGYEIKSPHPLAGNADDLLNAMKSDKKNKQDKLTFIVPDEKTAIPVSLETDNEKKILRKLISGGS